MMRSVNCYSLNSVCNNFLDLLPAGCTTGGLLNSLVLDAQDGTLKAEKNSNQPDMRCQWMISVDHGMVRPNIRFFSKCTRMTIMSILASEALLRENKEI